MRHPQRDHTQPSKATPDRWRPRTWPNDRARPRLHPEGCSMSDTALDDLKRIRAAFAEDRRAHIKEVVGLLPANRHAAFQEAREALDLQAEIEALDRAISDEESLADRPKGAA